MKPMLPQTTRILGSLIVVMGLIFLIMFFWYVTQPALMSFVLIAEDTTSGQLPTKGNWSVTIVKLAVNFWGVIAIVLLLVTYGIMQAQKRDWRGEAYPY